MHSEAERFAAGDSTETEPRADGGTRDAAPPVVGAPDGAGELLLDLRGVARGGVLNLVGVIASGALQFLLVVVVTRSLHAQGAGVFFEAVALFMIISNTGELGADTGLVRSVPRDRALGRVGEIRQTLWVGLAPVLAFGGLTAAAVYVYAPELTRIFVNGAHSQDAIPMIRFLAPFLPLASATTVVLSGTRGFGTMKPFVWIQNIALPAARPVLVIAAITGGLGTTALALGYGAPLVFAFAAALIAFGLLVRRAERSAGAGSMHRRPIATIAIEFWRFTGPRGLAAVFGITVTYFDVLLVGALRSTAEAGVYAAVSRLSIIGAYALQAVGMAIAPQVSGLMARKRPDRVETVLRAATLWLMALTWPLYLVLAGFAPMILRVFGPQFVSGQTALVILCVAMLFNLGTGNVLMVLLMAGKSSWNLLNTSISLFLNVTLNLILIPRLGINGSAIAWAISIIFVNLAGVLEVWFLLRIRPFGTGYSVVAVAPAVCFGALSVAMRVLLGTSIPTFAVFLPIAIGSYAFLLVRFRDRLHLAELFHSLRRGTQKTSRPS